MVCLSGAYSQTVTVDFATADGTAFATNDYVPTNGTLVFYPGQTNGTIPVTINLNNNSPPPRVFFLNLTNPVNAALGATQGIASLLNSTSPPALAPITNQTIHAQTTLSFYASASDPNNPNDTLSFSLDPGAPAGACIDSSTGLLTWMTADASVGTNFITVRVTDTDALSLSATQTFTVIVVPRPTISSIVVSGGQVAIDWSAIDGQTYRVQSKNSLSDPWNNVPGDVIAAGSVATKMDSSSLTTQRFYRVMVLP